ncbi:hypothetical protein [Haloferax larsenii]|uniref:Uncharacterized protein n=1 Tax=Haloferax larsenii TaxID=302484 RepID=A0A1H7LDH8_HALLR|nr:hypothetical protein [Haloferax larsenii]SEK96377.1 hypothetical protein SAMN04488691_102277 [Haloferax larsenii]
MDVIGVLAWVVVLGVLVYNLVSSTGDEGRLKTVIHGVSLLLGLLLLASYFDVTHAVAVDTELLMLVLALSLVPLLAADYLRRRTL